MSDIRGIPRRSKTAVIVVLVVFLQMLALAVVGIRAVNDDRERGRQKRVDEIRQAALAATDEARESGIEDVDKIIRSALKADTWSRLRSDRETWPEELVVQVFHVRSEFQRGGTQRVNSVLWLDHAFVLHQPLDSIETGSKQYEGRRVELLDVLSKMKSASALFPTQRLRRYVKALTDWPVLVRPSAEDPNLRWPMAAGWAYSLYDRNVLLDAVEGADEAPPQELVRAAVMQSLVVQGLNTGRAAMDTYGTRLVSEIREKALLSLNRIPADLRGDLGEEVGEFLEHRDFLANAENFTQFQAFVDAGIKSLDENPGQGLYLKEAGRFLFAMSMQLDGASFRVARLDPQALFRLLAATVARAEEVALKRLGMELRLQPLGSPVDEPLKVQTVEDGALRLPFELALYKVREVIGSGEGPSEVWYWGIIALAGMGLLFGTLILTRLWRREVRLAQLKADFVSNLSHELKTPLTSISLFTEMLKDGKFEDAPEDQAEAYAVLDQEALRLQRIVQRMIETARNEAQGTPYNLGPGDLNRTVLAAANRFRRIVTEPGLDLRISLATEPLPMMLDAPAMDDAVTNLLSNAWKYKRGDKAKISIATVRNGRRAEIVVSDDGIGIPRGERKRVFETFYRSEQFLTQPVQGTGLGLSLVRTIARAHKGRVSLAAGDDGVGTTVRMRFPLSRKAALIAAQAGAADDTDPTSVEEDRADARSSEDARNTGANA